MEANPKEENKKDKTREFLWETINNTTVLIMDSLQEAKEQSQLLQIINDIYYITINHIINKKKNNVILTEEEYKTASDAIVEMGDFVALYAIRYYALDLKSSAYDISQEELENIKIKVCKLLIQNSPTLFKELVSEELNITYQLSLNKATKNREEILKNQTNQ